jgi:two-component system CheB/CheR fusion protein
VRNQSFFNLIFGLPTAEVQAVVQDCLSSGQRTGPIHVAAINRIGRSINVTVTCSPLKSNGAGEGAVLLMEELYQE